MGDSAGAAKTETTVKERVVRIVVNFMIMIVRFVLEL